MATPALTTIIKMIEDLPEPLQNQVADHLREYLAIWMMRRNGMHPLPELRIN